MAGLVGHALTVGGFEASLLAFIVDGVVIVLLMFGLSLAVATAQKRLVATLRAHVGQVKRWGGWIQIGVGIWLIVFGSVCRFFCRHLPGVRRVWKK